MLCRHIKHTRFGFCLYSILAEMAKHDKPLFVSDDGSAWYALPLNYLVAQYGGSKRTWQGSITLAVSIGLLRKIKPDADSLHPIIKQLYMEGRQQGKAPKNLYNVPEYTPELLRGAETALVEWLATGVSTSKVTKASVTNAQGRATANTIFRDSRSKTARKAVEAAQGIIRRIDHGIATKGYMMKQEAIAGDVQAWQMLHGYILAEAGAAYHRPTQAERERYGLQDAAWIITASE